MESSQVGKAPVFLAEIASDSSSFRAATAGSPPLGACTVRRKGEVVEGSEDDIRATYYMLAFEREFLEEESELRWKVVDMMVVGGEARCDVLSLASGRGRLMSA